MRRPQFAMLAILTTLLVACQSASVLPDGRVLLVGGETASIFDPATGTVTETGAPMVARFANTATVLDDGRVLLAGGASEGGTAIGSAELYDPESGAFSATGDLTAVRALHSGTRLDDGRVLVAGGSTAISSSGGEEAVPVLSSAELYDPTTGTWTATGDLVHGRGAHTATLQADGRVVIIGGAGPEGMTPEVEVYDPAAGTFAVSSSLTTGRGYHTATLLGDGRVLVVGGIKGEVSAGSGDASNMLDTAELFDPSSGTFEPATQLSSVRVGHSATLLLDGRVLIAGGLSAEGEYLGTAELYDPTSGISTPTGSLKAARGFHAASLLEDGRVLLVGGDLALDSSGQLDMSSPSTEIYDPATGTFE